MQKEKRKIKLSPFFLVILSFLIVILLGGFLLTIPYANRSNEWSPFIDALFTAGSATCVTGLVSYESGVLGTLTFFGQLVVLICIQIGGLGFITIFAFIATFLAKRITFKHRYTLMQAVGAGNISQVKSFVRKIILISFTFETLGFLLGLPVFLINTYTNPIEGIWASLFHSISSYNNAGFDIFGTTSLIRGIGNPVMDAMEEWQYIYLNILTMLLIVSGGISFLTVIDLFHCKKHAKRWSLFTKVVLLVTPILILSGFVIFCLTDGIKGEGSMNPLQALFHSISLRTCGFATYNQDDISIPGRVFSCILMFIGGSPLSTAGGIKTVTAFVVVLAIYKYLRNKPLVCYNRHFSNKSVLKSMTLVFLSLAGILLSFIIISGLEKNNAAISDSSDIIYECFSAFGTVGVSTGITPYLSVGSKVVIIILMFLGRLGPITFFQIFENNSVSQSDEQSYRYVEEDLNIG